MSSSPKKHPLEDAKSWKLHLRRLEVEEEQTLDGNRGKASMSNHDAEVRRRVQSIDVVNAPFKKAPLPLQPLHAKAHHRKAPIADGDTVHGLMIDAGSQGTRIHVYEFERRILVNKADVLNAANGQKLSFPTTNSRWTDKYLPGLDYMAEYQDDDVLKEKLFEYLTPLVEFAKEILLAKRKQWKTFPIYLKATGGLRTLPQAQRVRIMKEVRKFFNNVTHNPFSFEDERARVISGEEEAIYGWTAVNFIKGTLIEQSRGTGTVLNPELTYGMVEMGGASTQIGVFENNGDVMANLFKLQIGGARHWNVYVHSFLYFGVNGAWSRLNAKLLQGRHTNVNPCLPAGSAIIFDSWMHLDEEGHFLPRSDPRSTEYSFKMINNRTESYEDCSEVTYSLLRIQANKEWCEFSHDGDCSFAGVYQPPLPTYNRAIDEFIATSNYADIFAFLKIGERATIAQIGEMANKVCDMNWIDIKSYNANLTDPITDDLELAQYCFRSTFVHQILRNGYGFKDDYKITAVDVLDGQKLGWALGSILYEINTLPWEFHPKLMVKGPKKKSKWSLLGSSASAIGGEQEYNGDGFISVGDSSSPFNLVAAILVGTCTLIVVAMAHRRRNQRHQYSAIESTGRL